MRAHVIGNAALDETFEVGCWPVPGESIFGVARGRDLGGKGANQALILARAGVNVRLTAPVGTDPEGDWIRSALAAEGLELAGLIKTEAPTDRSVILVGPGGENTIVTTAACAEAVTPDDAEKALAVSAPADMLLVQGNLRDETTRAALAAARRRGLVTAFNPSPARPAFADFWPMVDLAVLNEGEAAALAGISDTESAARAIRAAGAGQVVVTRGPRGAIMVSGGTETVAVKARSVSAIDTTGAGDTFMAVLVAAGLRRRAFDKGALEAAAAAAAITVSRRGTRSAFPTPAELAALMEA